jgi:erythromycin esterase
MKYFSIVILLLITSKITAQNEETVLWINENLIEIEDANPYTKLEIFDSNIPEKFRKAKIFGFGEATHVGKEFFNIKAKFFKYLVENHKVKTFIMEESFPAESGINEWISGGEGDIETIASNFSLRPWHTEEIVSLLKWMRDYNIDKPKGAQIQFYGMDIQIVEGINLKIRDFVNKYNLPVSEKLLSVIDSCTNKKVNYQNPTNWADIQLPKLKKIENIIKENQNFSNSKQHEELTSIIRALNYLQKYTYYIQHPKSEVRDQKMFENVKWIFNNKTKNGKAFIWAHNEHINNKEISPAGSGWISVGGHLKEFYGDEYYSVYFDFGKGKSIGYVTKRNKPNYWDIFEIEKPLRKSYAETLIESDTDIYFIDMHSIENDVAKNFFGNPKKQLFLGGAGYDPKSKKSSIIKKNYLEICDGLIFVKNISVPNYTWR